MRTLLLALVLSISATSFAHVRTVTLKKDQLLTVRTALGIATIIQVPDAIQSAVIGDQSGFKVEYMDRAITIKPLRYGAKTNLYLMTEKERFNVRLQTLSQDAADYVVYIAGPTMKKPTAWKALSKTATNGDVTLSIRRIAISANGVLLIDGSLITKRDLKISPEMFWVSQTSKSKVIDSLFLTSLGLKREKPVRFGLSILRSELDSTSAITLQFKSDSKPISLSLGRSEWNQ